MFSSRLQSLRAATSSLEENMPPLLRYWLSSRINKILMLCKFQATTSQIFFIYMWNEIHSVSLHCWGQNGATTNYRIIMSKPPKTIQALWVVLKTLYDFNFSDSGQIVQMWIFRVPPTPLNIRIMISMISMKLARSCCRQRLAARKSWETMPGVILNWLQPNFAAKNCCQICCNIPPSDDHKFFPTKLFINVHRNC